MMKLRNTGNFFFSYLINIILGFEVLIPAFILLILHFTSGLSLIWFFVSLGIGLLITLIRTILLTIAVNSGEPTMYNNKQEVKYTLKKSEENNPYTAKIKEDK